MRLKLTAAVLLFPVILSGCDWLPPEVQAQWDRLQKEFEALIIVATGGRSPFAKNGTGPSPSPSPAEGELASANAKSTKANAELLAEVWKVVLMREPRDRAEFASFVDSINQGASFEGIYNGFTHSSDFRQLEQANKGATPEALKAFGEELANLEAELPAPTEFGASAAQPLALPVDPGAAQAQPQQGQGQDAGANPSGVDVVEFGGKAKPAAAAGTPPAAAPAQPAAQAQPSGQPFDPVVMAEKYSRQFVGASIYTLKRILGDEALKVVASKRDYREKLAQWYSKWVVRMAARGVDFGISLRNKPDEQLHYRWAMSNTEDRLEWEVLNRLHRVLNDANRQKQ